MIEKMRKFTFLVYHKEYEAFLESLRELGVVHVEVRNSGEVNEAMGELLQQHASYKTLCNSMTTLLKGYKGKSAPTSESTNIDAVMEDFHNRQNTLQELNRLKSQLDSNISQMSLWGEFDWNSINELKANGWSVQFFSCPDKSFRYEWTEEYNAMPISSASGRCYFITVSNTPVVIDAETIQLPEQSLSQLEQQRIELHNTIEEKNDELKSYCAAHVAVVKSALAEAQAEIDLERVKFGSEKMADGHLLLMEGWAPEHNAADVVAMLDKSGVYYETRIAEKEDNAPIKLKNNFLTRAFETLTKMYGMPDYGEFDPTPLLAPFYALFFGFCVGDAGYGIFLVLLCMYLKKKVAPSMHGIMNLFITLGAATTFVGALFGTFFGFELVKLDLPESLKALMITGKFDGTTYDKTMVLALVVGMIHICFAMLIKGICSTARYGFKNSLSAWGWFLLVVGSVSVCTLNYLQIIDVNLLQTLLIILGIVSAIGIYILNNLKRNVFLNIGAGLWDTYNMATGLAGDLLSYLRLYALGLAGGMLGGVFNNLGIQLRDSLGDFWGGVPGWICFGLIFVFGHGLNMALSCLSGYVHSIRLTFVEYFKNSGYNGQGEAYKPFSTKAEED